MLSAVKPAVGNSLRKELVMAILKQRRGKWYARVQWYNANVKKEKQVPLKTMSKVTARQRLAEVNKVESDIRTGMEFTFPWLNDDQITSVRQLAISDAIKEWIKKNKKEIKVQPVPITIVKPEKKPELKDDKIAKPKKKKPRYVLTDPNQPEPFPVGINDVVYTGSGFIINNGREVITNRHVLKAPSKYLCAMV